MPLVYSSLQCPACIKPEKYHLERSKYLEAAKHAYMEEVAERRIAFGIIHAKDPKDKNSSTVLQKSPGGSPFLVLRT